MPEFSRHDQNLPKLVYDILWVIEYTIDQSDNEVLKNEFNYKPLCDEADEAEQATKKADDDQTVQEDQENEVEPTDSLEEV